MQTHAYRVGYGRVKATSWSWHLISTYGNNAPLSREMAAPTCRPNSADRKAAAFA